MKARETGQFSGRFFVSVGEFGLVARLEPAARLDHPARLELAKAVSPNFVMND